MPTPDKLSPLQRGLRTAMQVCITFSLATGAADVASQHAAPHQRPIWFGVVGGTTALCVWYGWNWLVKRARRA